MVYQDTVFPPVSDIIEPKACRIREVSECGRVFFVGLFYGGYTYLEVQKPLYILYILVLHKDKYLCKRIIVTLQVERTSE